MENDFQTMSENLFSAALIAPLNFKENKTLRMISLCLN